MTETGREELFSTSFHGEVKWMSVTEREEDEDRGGRGSRKPLRLCLVLSGIGFHLLD